VNAANVCFKAHDLNSVEFLASELGTHDTSTPWGPYFFARVALERDQLDRALWMVELSLRRAPDFGVTHYLKGQILWARKDFKEATSEFEKSVVFDDGIGTAHLILGQVYLRDQDYADAAPQFLSALKTLPDNIIALNGQAESQIHLNSPSAALEAYVRLSELDSADGQYLTKIGALYEGALNNPERALNAYQKLHDLIKSGKVKKNIDLDNDSKIKELQAALNKARSVASDDQKSASSKGGGH
jgi:tetratricopeptide (TPR) repeat protein